MIYRSFLEWYDDEEPGTTIAKRELRRLIFRARGKKFRILLLTFLISSFFIYRSITKLVTYSSSVTFRVIEQKRTMETGEKLNAQGVIIEYILDGVLNHQAALQVVKKHGLYPAEMKLDERLATRELINDLAITVSDNFFLETTSRNARSVHVKILYAAKDPDTSFAVVQDVARLIREDVVKSRRVETEQSMARGEEALQECNRNLNEIEAQMSQIRRQQKLAHGGEAALLRFKMRKLRGTQMSIKNQTDLITIARAENQLLASIEQHNVGLTFFLVDYTRPKLYEVAGVTSKILTGIIIFLVVLPFVGIVIATFDTRIMDENDVYRLGLEIVASVPPYPGNRYGSLEERWQQEKDNPIY